MFKIFVIKLAISLFAIERTAKGVTTAVSHTNSACKIHRQDFGNQNHKHAAYRQSNSNQIRGNKIFLNNKKTYIPKIQPKLLSVS